MTAVADALTAIDEASAAESLHELGATDGLPVVAPTAARVADMVAASGLDGDISMAVVGPADAAATVEKIAVNAVMAGCLPHYMPVVVAAVKAVTDPRFDLTQIQTTTHSAAPVLIVNGPARSECGPAACKWGALGPGHRANAAIGRAVRLVLMNLGGARPGVSDMTLLGHPAKFTYCVAENEEDSPFSPLATALGEVAGASAVTAVAVEAPRSVASWVDREDPRAHDRLLDAIAAGLACPAATNAYFGSWYEAGTVVVALNPDQAGLLAARGLDRGGIQRALFERARNPRGALRALNPGFVHAGNDEDLLPIVPEPQRILVMVAGGPGVYATIMPSFGAGPHGNVAVTVAVESYAVCRLD